MSNEIRFGIKLTYDGKEVAGGITLNREQLRQLTEEAKRSTAAATAGFDAVGAAAAKSGSAADKAAQQVKQSAGQTAFALRQLPMQMTDIATGLASGQSPFMVLMQQGGQLKDTFGGIAPAARAVGRYVAALVNPFTVAGAAAGALAVAYYQGHRESEALARSVIMSGNAAGTSAGQLQALAASVSTASGATKGAAAEALAGLTATGKVGADMLGTVATAALRLQRTGGQAVEDTVADFAALGKAPVDASLKLTDQYNYLTAAVYRQIKALAEQGKTEEAAALAQRAYADALVERSAKMDERLGVLEKTWRGLADAGRAAWDAMLGVGRADTPEEKMAALASRIQSLRDSPATKLDSVYGRYLRSQLAQAEKDYQATLAAKAAEGKRAEAAGKRAAAEKAAIDWARDGDKYLEKRVEMEREIAKARQMGTAAGMDQAEIDKRVAAIREKYVGAQDRSTLMARIEADGRLVEAALRDRLDEIDSLQKRGEIGVDEALSRRYTANAEAQMSRLRNLDRQMAVPGLARLDPEKLAQLKGQKAELMTAIGNAEAAFDRDRQELVAQRLKDEAASWSAIYEPIRAATNALREQNDTRGMTTLEIARERLAQFQLAEAMSGNRGVYEDLIAVQEQYVAELQRQRTYEEDWKNGASEALREYVREVDNAAARHKAAFAGAMRQGEDAIVGAMRGNKNAVRGFVDFAINEYLRLTAAQPFMRAVAGWSGSLFDGLFNGGNQGAGQVVANTPDTYSIPVSLSGPVLVGGNHEGGVAGAEATFRRAVPLSLFAGARRYHGGDAVIGPGEVPIIAKRGEGVFTEGQMRKLAPVDAARQGKPSVSLTYAPVIDARESTPGLLGRLDGLMRQSEQRVRAMLIAEANGGGEFAYATGRRG